MKTYIRFKQHKNSTPKHKTNGTTTEVSPWNDQLYKLTRGLKPVLMVPNLTLIFRSGSHHLVRCSVPVLSIHHLPETAYFKISLF